MWTEILHQSDLITSKENHLDYRHYYISTSLGDGRRRRTSSKFRREAYTMGDLTLITYIGDEKEASMPEKGPPQPPVTLQATTFHSLPRYFLEKTLPCFGRNRCKNCLWRTRAHPYFPRNKLITHHRKATRAFHHDIRS